MIRQSILSILLLGLLSGCAAIVDNSRFYDGSTVEAPQRWPDKVETCGISKTALVPLGIVVMGTGFSRLPGYAGGCGAFPYGHTNVEVENIDKVGTSRFGVDSTGRGQEFNVYYAWQLDANSNLKPSLDYTPDWTRHIPGAKLYSDIWQYNRPLPVEDKTVVINGLTWDHYMFYRFYSHDADPSRPAEPVTPGRPLISYDMYPLPVIDSPHPDALTAIGEAYVHKVGADHTMIVWANYDRTVTQDAHWLEVRRAMLRQLVESVAIEPLTPELLRQMKAERQAQTQCFKEKGGSQCTVTGRWSDKINSN